MVSWDTCMVGSSGKSRRSRAEICCGDQLLQAALLDPFAEAFIGEELAGPGTPGSRLGRPIGSVGPIPSRRGVALHFPGHRGDRARSEEHTSELQSHHDIVCRLLLEKKKK